MAAAAPRVHLSAGWRSIIGRALHRLLRTAAVLLLDDGKRGLHAALERGSRIVVNVAQEDVFPDCQIHCQLPLAPSATFISVTTSIPAPRWSSMPVIVEANSDGSIWVMTILNSCGSAVPRWQHER